MKKALKWILIVVPIVIIIAVVILVLRLDGIIRSTVASQSTASTNLTTTLEAAHMSIFGGKVSLNDLKIAPPKGYQSPTMFELKGVDVQVSYGQLTKTPMRIEEIVIDSPKLIVEQVGGKLNVQAAMDQMPKSEPSTLRMVIGKIDVKNTQVVVRPGLPMLEKEYLLTLPTITVRDVGTADEAKNGAAMKDVMNTLLAAMVEELKKSDKIPAGVRAWLGTSVDDYKAKATDELNKLIQKQTGGATTNDANQAVQQGLQNLLGGKKK